MRKKRKRKKCEGQKEKKEKNRKRKRKRNRKETEKEYCSCVSFFLASFLLLGISCFSLVSWLWLRLFLSFLGFSSKADRGEHKSPLCPVLLDLRKAHGFASTATSDDVVVSFHCASSLSLPSLLFRNYSLVLYHLVFRKEKKKKKKNEKLEKQTVMLRSSCLRNESKEKQKRKRKRKKQSKRWVAPLKLRILDQSTVSSVRIVATGFLSVFGEN